jgi:hypothetical protein
VVPFVKGYGKMKKSLILLVFVILCTAPALGSAQVLGSGYSAGFPSRPFVPSLGCGVGGGPGCDPGEPAPGIAPAFYVGLLEHRKGVTFGIDRRIPAQVDPFHVTWQSPLRGLWLGFELESPVSEQLAFSIGGGWLIPGQMDGAVIAEEEEGPLPNPFDSDTEYWFLEGMVAFNPGGTFQIIGGFRWDHFTSHLEVDLPEILLPDIQVDTRVEVYLPFIGVQCAAPPLTARMIFFPFVPGTIKNLISLPEGPSAEEFNAGFSEGYFLEFFGEYRQRMFGQAAIGAFVRWNLLHAEATGDVDLIPQGIPGEFTMVFDKRSWTLGGSFSFDFNLF